MCFCCQHFIHCTVYKYQDCIILLLSPSLPPLLRCMVTGCVVWSIHPPWGTPCRPAMTLPAPSTWSIHTGRRRAACSGSGRASPHSTTPKSGTSLVQDSVTRGNWSWIEWWNAVSFFSLAATGGLDRAVRFWNPYVTGKPIAVSLHVCT